jgi:hypothetical protein
MSYDITGLFPAPRTASSAQPCGNRTISPRDGPVPGLSGEELLLPAIKDVIINVDPVAHKMTVRPLPGLEWIGNRKKE